MTTEQKNALISAMIIQKVEETGDVRKALDAVVGEGTFDKLAGELYDELRAKAQ